MKAVLVLAVIVSFVSVNYLQSYGETPNSDDEIVSEVATAQKETGPNTPATVKMLKKLDPYLHDQKNHQYLFSVRSDESFQLFIDGALIISGQMVVHLGNEEEDSEPLVTSKHGNTEDNTAVVANPTKQETCPASPWSIKSYKHPSCPRHEKSSEKRKVNTTPLEQCRIVLGEGFEQIKNACEDLGKPFELITNKSLQDAAKCIQISPNPLQSLVHHICQKAGYIPENDVVAERQAMLIQAQADFAKEYDQKIVRFWWKMIGGMLSGSIVGSVFSAFAVPPVLHFLGFAAIGIQAGTVAHWIHMKAAHNNMIISGVFGLLQAIGSYGYTIAELIGYGGWGGGCIGLCIAGFL